MYSEDNFIMISSLQHYIFCPRQCALIHIDDVWQENLFTVRGEILHQRVDTDTYETRGDVKTVRGLRIHSYKYGLVGRCDVVEFKQTSKGKEILPVEFKAGQPKDDISDKVQLCAQAFCIEEMLHTKINKAAFFYGKIKRRNVIDIDIQLRSQTEDVISNVRKLITEKKIPIIDYSSKCRNCSLVNICQPKALNRRKLEKYLNELYCL